MEIALLPTHTLSQMEVMITGYQYNIYLQLQYASVILNVLYLQRISLIIVILGL